MPLIHNTIELDEYRNSITRELYKYTPLGHYPLYYLMDNNDVCCRECANEYPDEVTGVDVQWDGPNMQCDICNATLEFAK